MKDATSAIRVLPRWLGWPKLLRDRAWRTLSNNALAKRFHRWVDLCADAPDFPFVGYVLLFGAPLSFGHNRPPPTPSQLARNHPSALSPEFHSAVMKNRTAECKDGLLIRVPHHHLSTYQSVGFGKWLHPLGAVHKFDGTRVSGVRVIDDYSFPPGSSVNDHINYVRLRYDKVDHALAFVFRHPGCFAAKVDIKGFFRHVAVDPFDWPLMCALWDFGEGPELLADTHLPFGLRDSPEIACRFSLVVLFAVKRDMRALGIEPGVDAYVSVVVDDWLILGVTLSVCCTVWQLVLRTLKDLGFKVNEQPHKLLSPRQQIIWLGLELNTIACTISLPRDKVEKGLTLLRKFMSRFAPGGTRKCTRSELDSLIGYLSYCAGVVYGGRAFLHRMRRLRFRGETGVAMPCHYHIFMNLEFRLDLVWWWDHLVLLNGAATIVDPADDCDIRLDATGHGGLGIFCDGGFVSLSPARVRCIDEGAGHPLTDHSNEWELFSFVVLLRLYGEYLRDRVVSPVNDNACAVCAISKWRVGELDAQYCAATLRTLFSLCVRYNVRLCPRWIPGESNILADALSRATWPIVSQELQTFAESASGRPSIFCRNIGM